MPDVFPDRHFPPLYFRVARSLDNVYRHFLAGQETKALETVLTGSVTRSPPFSQQTLLLSGGILTVPVRLRPWMHP